MQVIKAKLSDEQKRQLKMTFNLMDADGGGTIDGKATTTEPQGAGSHVTGLTALIALHMTFLGACHPQAMLLCSAGGELGNAFQVTGLIPCLRSSLQDVQLPCLLESLCSFVVPLYLSSDISMIS